MVLKLEKMISSKSSLWSYSLFEMEQIYFHVDQMAYNQMAYVLYSKLELSYIGLFVGEHNIVYTLWFQSDFWVHRSVSGADEVDGWDTSGLLNLLWTFACREVLSLESQVSNL